MNREERVNKLALEILDHLNNLEGFDGWWELLDENEQMETLREIKELINDAADYL